MDKCEIRNLFKAVRKSVKSREMKEQAIADKLLALAADSRSVFIYESIGGEVSTSGIIEQLGAFAKIFVPEVCGKDMRLKMLGAEVYTDKPCDITVVPLIAFDATLNRIGFGGGYYDRYLASADTLAIGIAFDEQQCEIFEKEKTDHPLDIIITPTRILKKNEDNSGKI